MRKQIIIFTVLILLLVLAGCYNDAPKETNTSQAPVKANNSTSSYSSSSSASAGNNSTGTSTSFTNKYGTPTTRCAHSGCSNFIASSGDTNCCTTHSHKCLECGKYIDEDATWCMDCIEKAANKAKSSSSQSTGSSSSSSGSKNSKGPWHSSNVKSDGMGPYPCYGKGDTCKNTTNNYKDLYCDSCDPDGDNREN